SQTCTGTYTLVAADITAGQVLNTAMVDSDQTPPVTDNETVSLVASGLALIKTGAFVDSNGDNRAQVGETIAYTFMVTNTGNIALTNISVTDPLISVINCTTGNPIPTLAVGASQFCTGSHTLGLADIDAGQVINTATADSDQTPPVSDTVTVVIPIGQPPNILYFDPSISKIGRLGPGQLGLVGEDLTWFVTITNIGNAPGTNVVICDVLVSELQVNSATIDVGTVTVQGQEVCFFVDTLAPGQVINGQINSTVLDTPASGVIQNTVTLTGTGTDGVVQVESATAVVPVPTGLPATGYPPIPDKSASKAPFIWIVISATLMTLVAGGWYLRKQKVI
ncbi:MAG: DUF11 domain-containing protein, partial [Chloroflexi bacterium]|nr:DUF11 domain-containing protein [Chloroflexota bacterium]